MKKAIEAMVAEIRESFAGVTRVGGLSWSQATEGKFQSTEEWHASGQEDLDRTWMEVADDPDWDVEAGFAFLDPIGWRFYLPAAMTVAARGGSDETLSFALRRSHDPKLREYQDQRRSLLDERQRQCVKHFIDHMILAYWNASDKGDAESGARRWEETRYYGGWESTDQPGQPRGVGRG